MEKTSDADKLKALWDALVLPLVKSPPDSQEERELALLAAFQHYRLSAKSAAELEAPYSHIEWARAIEKGRIIWTLLASEPGCMISSLHPLEKITREDIESGSPEEDRAAIIDMLRDLTSRFFSDGLDLAGIVLPRRLANDLRKALIALDFGTALPLLAPSSGGSKYSLAVMRMRAVEHVQFLAGQGIKLNKARARVGSAIGHPASTLRDWEGEIKKDVMGKLHLRRAHAAGELDRLLDSNPDYGKNDGNSIDIDVLRTLEELWAEPLKIFGLKWTGPDAVKSWGTVSAEKEQ